MGKKTETAGDLGDKNQVAITPEDVQECAKFFEFFEIPVPAALQSALDSFIKEPTLEHQNELRFQLSDIIANSKHPVFQDEVFTQVKPENSIEHDQMTFERELEKQLTVDEDK